MYEDDVRNDEKEAYSKGIHSVPFFVIEGKYHILGVQPLEAMIETLRRGLDVRAMSCGAEECRL